jgi:hypothetical protein
LRNDIDNPQIPGIWGREIARGRKKIISCQGKKGGNPDMPYFLARSSMIWRGIRQI